VARTGTTQSPSPDYSRLVTRQRRDREGTYEDANRALSRDYGSRRRSCSLIIIIYDPPPPRSVVDGHRDVASLRTWSRSPHCTGSLRLHFFQRLRRTLNPSGRDGRSHGAGRNGPVHLHDPGGHTIYIDDIKTTTPSSHSGIKNFRIDGAVSSPTASPPRDLPLGYKIPAGGRSPSPRRRGGDGTHQTLVRGNAYEGRRPSPRKLRSGPSALADNVESTPASPLLTRIWDRSRSTKGTREPAADKAGPTTVVRTCHASLRQPSLASRTCITVQTYLTSRTIPGTSPGPSDSAAGRYGRCSRYARYTTAGLERLCLWQAEIT